MEPGHNIREDQNHRIADITQGALRCARMLVMPGCAAGSSIGIERVSGCGAGIAGGAHDPCAESNRTDADDCARRRCNAYETGEAGAARDMGHTVTKHEI